MSGRRDTRTLDLFGLPPAPEPRPASMDHRGEVSVLVSRMLKEADGDRYEIAARMSRLTGTEVSKYMLDAWASEAREAHNLPFWAVPALEAACETHALTHWLAARRGARVLVGRETLTAELGRLERMRDQAARKIRELKRLMGELEDAS